MPVISVRIPQMGEGLQEALLVEFIKKPGEVIKRDDPIYVMETDKATTDVESPYDGTLVEWTAEPGSVLAIGSEVGKMEVAEGVKEMPAGHGPSDSSGVEAGPSGQSEKTADSQASADSPNQGSQRSDVVVPPRTRKYLKEKGLLDAIDSIPVAGKKMMPDDVDRYLEKTSKSATAFEPQSNEEFSDSEIPKSQVTLNYRLVRGASTCVPVTVMQTVSWEAIARARAAAKESATAEQPAPTGFFMLLECVVQAISDHDKLRSSIVGEGKYLRTYQDVNLGIAVGLPGDELMTAVVKKANQLDRQAFFQELVQSVEAARGGQDQADASVSVTVSNIGSAGMRWGIPAIVSPAVATIAVGEVYDQPIPDGESFRFEKTADLILSFDHRIMNGLGAADFMNDLKEKIQNYS